VQIVTPVLRLACGVLLLGSCSPPAEPDGTPPLPVGPLHLRHVSGNIPDDSVATRIRDPLVYEVADSTGVPAAGIAIRFRSGDSTAYRPGPGTPFVSVGDFRDGYGPSGAADLSVRTDTLGRVAVLVERGIHAGAGILAVSVDSLNLADTLFFHFFMSTPDQLRLAPHDTAIVKGTSFSLRALLTDRWGNLDSTSTQVHADSTFLGLVNRTVTGLSYGYGSLSARYGMLEDIARVSVVPSGTLAAVEAPLGRPAIMSVVLFEADGSNRSVLRSWPTATFDHWSIDWLDHATLVTPDPAGPGLVRITLDGAMTPISLNLPQDGRRVRWVQAAPDGRTVYFAFELGLAEIWKGDVQTGAVSLVVGSGSAYIDTYPSISSDGRWLAFTTTRTGAARIAIQDLTQPTNLQVTSLLGVSPRWIPQAQRIVFINGSSVRSAASDGSDQRFLTPVGLFFDIGLDVSPDGRWVAAPLSGHGIGLIEIETARVIPLVPADIQVHWTAWRP
jgi:WD40 repeat protein